jgi:RNA polymerase sigma-70 factor (ECF subfamily)
VSDAQAARRAVEAVARASYARLVSYVAARTRDVANAEDALSDAFAAALRTWPDDGVPTKPEAWLLHAARRRLIDRARLDHTRDANAIALRQLMSEAEAMSEARTFPDERLKLLFVCAHPAIDARVHTPLMLQVVLGLEATEIAAAFLTPAATIGQRLSRAKAKIRDTHIRFDVPSGAELPERLFAVLEAIYAAYAFGWDDVSGTDEARPLDSRSRGAARPLDSRSRGAARPLDKRRELRDEALWLARTVVELMPDEPEALGLSALLHYCEARRPARRDAAGDYVPISEQDTRAGKHELLAEAARLLSMAVKHRRPGRFQLEAAIQSAHVERMRTGSLDWAAIADLYEGLVQLAPTFGALLGRAAAGLALLDRIPEQDVEQHQPYWAVRAHLLHALGREEAARHALDRALHLTDDDSVRRFLERKFARAPNI